MKDFVKDGNKHLLMPRKYLVTNSTVGILFEAWIDNNGLGLRWGHSPIIQIPGIAESAADTLLKFIGNAKAHRQSGEVRISTPLVLFLSVATYEGRYWITYDDNSVRCQCAIPDADTFHEWLAEALL